VLAITVREERAGGSRYRGYRVLALAAGGDGDVEARCRVGEEREREPRRWTEAVRWKKFVGRKTAATAGWGPRGEPPFSHRKGVGSVGLNAHPKLGAQIRGASRGLAGATFF
jgi:hypothetical protein